MPKEAAAKREAPLKGGEASPRVLPRIAVDNRPLKTKLDARPDAREAIAITEYVSDVRYAVNGADDLVVTVENALSAMQGTHNERMLNQLKTSIGVLNAKLKQLTATVPKGMKQEQLQKIHAEIKIAEADLYDAQSLIDDYEEERSEHSREVAADFANFAKLPPTPSSKKPEPEFDELYDPKGRVDLFRKSDGNEIARWHNPLGNVPKFKEEPTELPSDLLLEDDGPETPSSSPRTFAHNPSVRQPRPEPMANAFSPESAVQRRGHNPLFRQPGLDTTSQKNIEDVNQGLRYRLHRLQNQAGTLIDQAERHTLDYKTLNARRDALHQSFENEDALIANLPEFEDLRQETVDVIKELDSALERAFPPTPLQNYNSYVRQSRSEAMVNPFNPESAVQRSGYNQLFHQPGLDTASQRDLERINDTYRQGLYRIQGESGKLMDLIEQGNTSYKTLEAEREKLRQNLENNEELVQGIPELAREYSETVKAMQRLGFAMEEAYSKELARDAKETRDSIQQIEGLAKHDLVSAIERASGGKTQITSEDDLKNWLKFHSSPARKAANKLTGLVRDVFLTPKKITHHIEKGRLPPPTPQEELAQARQVYLGVQERYHLDEKRAHLAQVEALLQERMPREKYSLTQEATPAANRSKEHQKTEDLEDGWFKHTIESTRAEIQEALLYSVGELKFTDRIKLADLLGADVDRSVTPEILTAAVLRKLNSNTATEWVNTHLDELLADLHRETDIDTTDELERLIFRYLDLRNND